MKNKKVFTYIGLNRDLSALLQERCFAAGLQWSWGKTIKSTSDNCLGIWADGTLDCSSAEHFRKYPDDCQELSIPEMFAYIENFKATYVVLSNTQAEIKNNRVRIFNQYFSFDDILKLADAIKEKRECKY